ncbi:hypothetical protein Y032_0045g1240 [Ancylostoma ceylanicum]|uniref:Uncharacterized protein n=1 Tax=Ancylostoma ceylanicum TaxID=53326 RepID=A0A016UDU3_9BILA|nr:hypothetical protein Y032_0045g1240 [Ancylostoma ceylanicum]
MKYSELQTDCLLHRGSGPARQRHGGKPMPRDFPLPRKVQQTSKCPHRGSAPCLRPFRVQCRYASINLIVDFYIHCSSLSSSQEMMENVFHNFENCHFTQRVHLICMLYVQ